MARVQRAVRPSKLLVASHEAEEARQSRIPPPRCSGSRRRFLDNKPSPEVVRRVEATAAPAERVVIDGREIYAWHPDTIVRSKLWALLAGPGLEVTATARNWTTAQKLFELADARAPS